MLLTSTSSSAFVDSAQKLMLHSDQPAQPRPDSHVCLLQTRRRGCKQDLVDIGRIRPEKAQSPLIRPMLH